VRFQDGTEAWLTADEIKKGKSINDKPPAQE
jgi:hypothetical protein